MDLIKECKRLFRKDRSTLHRRSGQAAKRRHGIGFHMPGTMILFKAYILRVVLMYIYRDFRHAKIEERH